MNEENIYQTPKSNLLQEDRLGFNGLVLREKNIIVCIILTSIFSYTLGLFEAERSGKNLVIMSPFFLGGLFPVTVILSAFIIRFLGNTNKVRVDYVISLRACWSLGWRVILSAILSMFVITGLSILLGFRADHAPVAFFFVYWVIVLPFSAWLLFAMNKKAHIKLIFRVARGY